jgi:predicted dehydrogenase
MEYRYMPPIAALVAEAEAATGGVRMLSIREHRFPFLPKVGGWNRFDARTGGTFVEKCCHFFDLMRLILRSEPVRVMASGGQAVRRDAGHPEGASDVWDHGYVLLDWASAPGHAGAVHVRRGSLYQEEIAAVGPMGKIEAQVPGPGRFWPAALGPAPPPRLTLSPRHPKGPVMREVLVDPALLAAGDHNGATFFQHARFAAVVRGEAAPAVSLRDGERAVTIGRAAQDSARRGEAVTIPAP